MRHFLSAFRRYADQGRKFVTARPAGRGLSVALLVVVTAACSGPPPEHAPVASGSPAASPASSADRPRPALTAADGTDAKACRDGRCQIIVKKKADNDRKAHHGSGTEGFSLFSGNG